MNREAAASDDRRVCVREALMNGSKEGYWCIRDLVGQSRFAVPVTRWGPSMSVPAAGPTLSTTGQPLTNQCYQFQYIVKEDGSVIHVQFLNTIYVVHVLWVTLMDCATCWHWWLYIAAEMQKAMLTLLLSSTTTSPHHESPSN